MARTGTARSAADFLPPDPTVPRLRSAAATCRGCELYRDATQTVFSEGPARARVMFVGEEPGDREDRLGRPFVGPAGRLLDEALAAAGIDRGGVYLTNAVKHFRFIRKELTKRRLHKKPTTAHLRACQPWLREEIRLVRPVLVVALGSTAAESLLGGDFRVTKHRGEIVQSEWAGQVYATVHPSSVLRAPAETRREARAEFFRDISGVAAHLRSAGKVASPRPSRPVTAGRPRRTKAGTRRGA